MNIMGEVGSLGEAYRQAVEATKVSRAKHEQLVQETWAAEHQVQQDQIAEERALVAYAKFLGIPIERLMLYRLEFGMFAQQKNLEAALKEQKQIYGASATAGESQ